MTTLQEAAMREALEYAEAQCGNRCNAEYNPCWAQEVADALRTALAPQPAQEPVKFLANGTRFKLSLDDEGKVSCFWNRKELDGRWVALVAAEDNCHLQSAQPVAPLTDEQVQRAMHAINEVSCGDIQPTFEEMRVALLAARGIKEGK